ncbi:TPA: peptidase domain-containing ABC transporter [Providencia rettgeri]|nr:peptidase domain-containing ABC transporter [Providencia rettgeri]
MFLLKKRTPLVLQSESSECGLACLAMISGYFGKNIDITSARNIHTTTNNGMTLQEIITAFEKINMTARAARIEIDELKSLRYPTILHWKLNHFIVLVKITSHKAIIHDPSVGRRIISFHELSDKFTGFIIEAWPEQTFNKEPLTQNITIFYLFNGVRGLLSTFLTILILSILIEILSVSVPIATQFTIDILVRSSDHSGILLVGVIIIFTLIIKSMFSILRAWVLLNMRYSLSIKWSEGFFSRLIKLTLPFFEKRHTGDIASRFQSLNSIQDAFTANMVESLLDVIVIIISAIILILYSPILAIGPMLISIIYIAIRLILFSNYQSTKIENILFDSIQSSHFLETIRAISTIKTLNLEEVRRREWINNVIKNTYTKNKLFKFDLLTSTISTFLIGLSNVYVLIIGALYFDQEMTIGILLASILYSDMISTRTVKITNAIAEFYLISMHCHRLTDIIISPIENKGEKKFHHNNNGHLKIINLSYRRSQNEPFIIKNVNFEINPGESVAIVGFSGCGKSTLLHILSGLYSPTDGDVLINGISISTIGKNQIRDHISFVMQDDKLLAGSISKNISSFNEIIDHEKMVKCAKLASIDDDINTFPRGYDTMIGDIGNTLSGGQKQRISIARALYREPQILLLDEATSDLDVINEKNITNAIAELKITRIFVAHRPEMINSADRIYDLSLNKWVK